MASDDLRKAANDIADGAQDAAGRARGEASRAASSIGDAAGDAASQATETAQTVYGKAKDGIAGLRDQMPGSTDDVIDAGRRAYAQGSEHIGRQVARQPIEALLLAGAIGFLVGWATNRS